MKRRLVPVGFALALCTVSLQAQEGPQRGRIKKVTADTITITADGQDVECTVSADTKIVDAANQAITPLNPEPYAYESGFSVKWLIEQQLKGDPSLNYDPKKGPVKTPWLSWGPYLWDNGVIKRADGYHPEESDFAGDGTHHAGPGMEKMGTLLLHFFKTDSTAQPWFARQ